MSAIQGAGLEGCLQFGSGVWIRGMSAIQGAGLEGCLQFGSCRGLD